MTVYVQCESSGGVSKIPLHSLYIVTRSDGGDSVRMPEIMETGVRSSDCRHSFFKASIDGKFSQMAPQFIREHKPGIFPQAPGLKMLLCLGCSVVL